MSKTRAFTLALVVAVTAPAAAQQRGLHPRWEIPGFDFSPNGAFRTWARRVMAYRAQLLASRQFRALNAPLAAGGAPASAAAVSGTLQIPAVLFQFKGGTLPTTGRDTSDYTTTLFGVTPPGGRPYTVRTFYKEMSQGLLTLQGHALGYVTLDSGETYYAGVPGTCTGNPFGTTECNGLFSTSAQLGMQLGLREALRKVESVIHPDWSQFSYDSTTGILNLVIFIQPALDGACGGTNNNHLWSHRWAFVDSSFSFYQPYQTQTPWPGHAGQNLKILDYTLQSGVGGASACADSTAIMPIGTATHETGHAFDLPDLYDTQSSSEGVGEWSLMGSGNYTSPSSPSRMDPWSLEQLGWITIVPVTTNGTLTFGPVTATTDTAFYFRPRGSNPRGEYFLVENRQAVLADTALIRHECAAWTVYHGPAVTCQGGLLVWHVDSLQIVQHGFSVDNTVNSGPVHGVSVVQADGFGDLETGANRGDLGDLYPGATGNVAYGYGTTPAAVKNADGAYVGFTIDSIRQVVAGGEMAFRALFGGLVSVKASDSVNARIKVDGTPYAIFRSLLDSGSVHTIAADSVQYRPDSSARYTFQSWSDGGAASHSVTIGANDTTFLAALAAEFRVKDTIVGPGTITGTATPGYFADGTAIQRVAHASGGSLFFGWSGDTSTVDSILSITVHRPYALVANFGAPLQVPDVLAQMLNPAAGALTPQEVSYLDAHGNANNAFLVDVGDFLAWVRANHLSPAPAAPSPRRAVAAKGGRP